MSAARGRADRGEGESTESGSKKRRVVMSRPQDSAAFSDVIAGLFWPPAETGGLFQSIDTEGKAASL